GDRDADRAVASPDLEDVGLTGRPARVEARAGAQVLLPEIETVAGREARRHRPSGAGVDAQGMRVDDVPAEGELPWLDDDRPGGTGERQQREDQPGGDTCAHLLLPPAGWRPPGRPRATLRFARGATVRGPAGRHHPGGLAVPAPERAAVERVDSVLYASHKRRTPHRGRRQRWQHRHGQSGWWRRSRAWPHRLSFTRSGSKSMPRRRSPTATASCE